MNMEFFILDGYGQFVWPAFIFTIVSCFFLYLKTKKEFQKQEKIYLKEFKQLQTKKIEVDKKKFNIAGKMNLNDWKGNRSIEFIIEDISLKNLPN